MEIYTLQIIQILVALRHPPSHTFFTYVNPSNTCIPHFQDSVKKLNFTFSRYFFIRENVYILMHEYSSYSKIFSVTYIVIQNCSSVTLNLRCSFNV